MGRGQGAVGGQRWLTVNAAGQFAPFAKPSANARYLRRPANERSPNSAAGQVQFSMILSPVRTVPCAATTARRRRRGIAPTRRAGPCCGERTSEGRRCLAAGSVAVLLRLGGCRQRTPPDPLPSLLGRRLLGQSCPAAFRAPLWRSAMSMQLAALASGGGNGIRLPRLAAVDDTETPWTSAPPPHVHRGRHRTAQRLRGHVRGKSIIIITAPGAFLAVFRGRAANAGPTNWHPVPASNNRPSVNVSRRQAPAGICASSSISKFESDHAAWSSL